MEINLFQGCKIIKSLRPGLFGVDVMKVHFKKTQSKLFLHQIQEN